MAYNATPLHELADLNGGYAFKSKDYADEGVFVLRTLNISEDGSITTDGATYLPNDLAPQYENFYLKERDTLFVMVGATLGKVGYVRNSVLPALLNQNMWRIRARPEKCDPIYLHYAFRNTVSKLIGSASGSAREFLRRDDCRNLLIPTPSPKTQSEIGETLAALDDKIELNKKQNATLEAMAQAIFKSWFVDFDPVKAKAEGHQPEGMDAATADLFPSRLVESDLGLLPKGWAKTSLEKIADFNPSETIPKGHLAPYMDMAALPTTGCWPDTPIQRAFSSGTKFRNKDTLLARITPCLENGKTAYVMNLPPNIVGWGSTEFIVMRAKEQEYSELLYILARTPGFRAHAIQSMTGTSGRQRARTDVVAAYPITLPQDKRIASEFSAIVSVFFEKIKENSQQNETLSLLRDTLLPRLVSGKLRIKQVAGED